MLHLKLIELRNKIGLSQAAVAKILNISRQAYSLYEINKRQMSFDTLCLLADFYEISTDYLLGRVDGIPSFLSEEERRLLDQFRALDERAREGIKNSLSFEYERTTQANAEKNRQCDILQFQKAPHQKLEHGF